MIPADRAARVQGYGEVVGSDGHRIGKVGQVYLDRRTGGLSWLTVRTGWFGNRESFVAMGRASVDGDLILVPYDKDTVKGAPHHASDVALTVADEHDLHAYYGMDIQRDADDPAGGDIPDPGSPPIDIDDTPGGTPGPAGRAEPPDVQTASAAPDGYLTLSGEQLEVATRNVEAGRARLRKYVVTEQQSVTVPVERDAPLVIREPIVPGEVPDPTIGEDAVEIVLTRDRVDIDRETVGLERVRLATETVVDQQQVSDTVRREQVEVVTDMDPEAVRPVRSDTRRSRDADTAPPS